MRKAWIAVFFGFMAGCTPVKKESIYSSSEAYVDLRPYIGASGYELYGSPEELLKKLEMLGGAQKDFETNSEYGKRVSALHRSAVFSRIPDFDIKFNKETGAISFESMMFDVKDLGYKAEGNNKVGQFGNSHLSIDLLAVDAVKGSYTGQNSFGVKAEVDVLVSDRIYLVFPPFPNVSSRTVFASLVSELDISAKELEEQRGNIRLAVLFEPRGKVLQADKHYGTATLSNRRDATVNNYYIDMNLAGIGVVNIKTNKIYSKRVRVKLKVL
ncbi:hypothetical protein [Pseudomonas syringae group genomosp. 3]|nr:hypothetical protein [Pseudomonas syringae group genomosp. 3]RMU93864.1 hypothetical protein ALP19_04099 [Pseudomonas syringae pv. tomato]